MKIGIENFEITKNNEVERTITVDLPISIYESEVDKQITKVSKNVKIPGFRPGKIPASVIEKKYGESIKHEAVNSLIKNAMMHIYDKLEDKPITTPEITSVNSDNKEKFVFTAKYEVKPHIVIKDLSKVEIVEKNIKVLAKDVKEMLNKILLQNATWKSTKTPAKDKSKVFVDFEGKIDGKVFEGGTGENVDFIIGAKTMLPEFENGVMKMKPGDETSVDVNFPEDYQAKEVAGKKAVFTIKVIDVQNSKLPKIDSEFLSKYGKDIEDEKQLSEKIKLTMESEAHKYEIQSFKDNVFAELVKIYDFKIPKQLIDKESLAQLEEYKTNMKSQGQDVSSLKPSMFDKISENKLKLSFILDEYDIASKIEITEEEIKEKVKILSATYSESENVQKWMLSDENELNKIKSFMFEEKIARRIAKDAKIKVETINYSDLMR
jgi:trigger factor